MSRARHTEAEIIAVLKQVEAGLTAEDVAREVGVSKHRICAWKAKYGGMKGNFFTPLGNPAEGAGFPLSHRPGGGDVRTAEQIGDPDVVL